MIMKYPFVINENDIQETNIGWFVEEFKNLDAYGFEMAITDILKKNGWKLDEDTDWGAVWKKDFCIEYTTTVYATIGYKPFHLDGCWKYGLQWLEGKYEYADQAHGKRDLTDMYEAMRIAIEHLLAKGIPFHPSSDIARQKDYWHLTNQEIKRNIDLLNATRLLEFNYKAVKAKFICEEEFEKHINEDRHREYEWMREINREEKEKK